MTCEQCNNLFVEAYYKELDEHDQREFEQHLSGCRTCPEAFREMQQTLALMARRTPATPDEAFSNNLWTSLKSNIATEPARAHRRIFTFTPGGQHMTSLPAWAYSVAAILLLAIGIYVGRTYFSGAPGLNTKRTEESLTSAPATPDSLSPEAVQNEVDAYLDRSRTLLLGLIHSPDTRLSAENFATQQQVSRELIQQASLIEAKLREPDRERFKQLIGDLTVIFRELANYSNESGVPLIEIVRQGVDEKSIMLKINIEQIRSFGGRLQSAQKKSAEPKSKI
jgi:hypothetical protein